MKTVKFTEMKKGSKEDYELLAEYEKNYVNTRTIHHVYIDQLSI